MENQNVIRKYSEDRGFGYGKVCQQDNSGKFLEFSVSNHLEEDKKYKFRYVAKCKAGFLNISESTYEETPKQFIENTYNFLDNVQVWKEFENGKGIWLNVLCTKGKKFYSIDKSFLLNLTVSNMHNAWKKMVDFNLWKKVGAKTHADYVYKMNNVATEEVAV